jgi:hypothetical protein
MSLSNVELVAALRADPSVDPRAVESLCSALTSADAARFAGAGNADIRAVATSLLDAVSDYVEATTGLLGGKPLIAADPQTVMGAAT